MRLHVFLVSLFAMFVFLVGYYDYIQQNRFFWISTYIVMTVILLLSAVLISFKDKNGIYMALSATAIVFVTNGWQLILSGAVSVNGVMFWVTLAMILYLFNLRDKSFQL